MKKYVAAYFEALGHGLKVFGAIYLVVTVLDVTPRLESVRNGLPLYLAYLSLWIAICGPLRVYIEKIEKENPIV